MKSRLMVLLLSGALGLGALAQTTPRTPEGVKAYRNMEYVENGHERHKLDLFVPEKAEGPLPLLIWVHGGGWQNGSKDGCPPLREGYTGRGYAVASINYRLSGHATFPAQIEDCKAAIRWLRANAKKYNLDPKRFGVWGSSAGGHLVALIGTSGGVKEFEVGPNLDQSSSVQAVCDYYGPTDFIKFVTTPKYESHATDSSPEAKLLGGAVLQNKDKAVKVNPITYVSKDDPPFLIVHGDKDGTVPINQSEALFEALKKNGTQVHFHTIHGGGHGRPGFGGPEITGLVVAFFDKFLKNAGKEPYKPEATTSESTTTETVERPAANQAQPKGGNNAQMGNRPTFDQVIGRDDKNKDGKLSKEEFRGPPALFQRLDRNGDGFLDKEEHDAAFQRQRPNNSPAPPKREEPSKKPDAAKGTEAKASGIKDFKLEGQEWTCVADGEPLQGILVKPEGKGPFPALLISHGLGGNARQFGLPKAREFAKLGMVCIATDYTHSQPKGDRSDFGASDENVRRAKACLAILKSMPEVDGKRMAAYGNSMGAFLTIRLAADAADLLKACAITAGGISQVKGYPAPSDEVAGRVKVPMLILHGTTDTTVRPELSEALKQALDAVKVPNERKLFEGVSHNLHVAKADEVNGLMKGWFEKYGVLGGE